MPRLRANKLGLLAPQQAPDFELVRKPLYTLNAVSPQALVENVDPVESTNATQTDVYHYQTFGNNYVRLPWHGDMKFQESDYFAFKCYLKPYSVNGRVLLYSNKQGLLSGGIFVDFVDGCVGVGWYDSVQKREVVIRTDVPVLRPGRWHYLYVRKKFPRSALNCWQDSIHAESPASARDVLVVREMTFWTGGGPESPSDGYWPDSPTWISKQMVVGAAATGGAARDSVSFTSDLEYSVAGCNAVGLVSLDSVTYTGDASGFVTATASLTSDVTGSRMIHANMLFQFSTANGEATDGKLYVVSGGDGTGTVFTLIDPIDGSSPDLSGYGALSTGGVFTGVRLVKSEGFSTAVTPENSSTDIEMFGSHLALYPASGISPYIGEFSSFACVVDNKPSNANPDLFEEGSTPADEAQIGLDEFNVMDGVLPWGELSVDSGFSFAAVDTQVYGTPPDDATSSVPNEDLEFTLDAASDGNASPPVWEYLGNAVPAAGLYASAVAFYNPEQADITPPSAPSPTRFVRLPGEDKTNPSGYVGLRFYNLPTSRDAGPIQRWIYLSELGGGEMFRVAVVPDNVSTDIMVTRPEAFRPRGPVLQLDNGAPPECKYLQVTQGVLAFCAAAGQPDLIVWSKPFFIGAVPYSRNLFQVPSGASEEITGVADFNGRILAFKRDAVYRAVLRNGSAVYDRLTGDIGCISHATLVTLQNRLYWVGEQGWSVYTGSGLPFWMSSKLESFFNDGLDQESAGRMVAAVNRRRNQVVLAAKELDASYQSHRLTAEFDRGLGGLGSVAGMEDGHRFGRYDDPGLVCLASLRDSGGQTSRLIGGTDDGFAVWLDRADTGLVMLGDTAAIWGASTLTAGASPTTTKLVLGSTPTMDLTQSHARGSKVRWGTSSEAVVLFAEANALHLDKVTAETLPASGDALTLGTRTRYWRTKWLDMGVPEARKRLRHLDAVYTQQSSGTVTVTAYEEFGTTGTTIGTLDMTDGFGRLALDRVQARFVQFDFRSTTAFEITELIVRVSDADPR